MPTKIVNLLQFLTKTECFWVKKNVSLKKLYFEAWGLPSTGKYRMLNSVPDMV